MKRYSKLMKRYSIIAYAKCPLQMSSPLVELGTGVNVFNVSTDSLARFLTRLCANGSVSIKRIDCLTPDFTEGEQLSLLEDVIIAGFLEKGQK